MTTKYLCLRELREKAKVHQSDVAAKVTANGTPLEQPTLSMIERGLIIPSDELVIEIYKAIYELLDQSVGEFNARAQAVSIPRTVTA